MPVGRGGKHKEQAGVNHHRSTWKTAERETWPPRSYSLVHTGGEKATLHFQVLCLPHPYGGERTAASAWTASHKPKVLQQYMPISILFTPHNFALIFEGQLDAASEVYPTCNVLQPAIGSPRRHNAQKSNTKEALKMHHCNAHSAMLFKHL